MTEELEYTSLFELKEDEILETCKDCLKNNVCSYYPRAIDSVCWKEE